MFAVNCLELAAGTVLSVLKGDPTLNSEGNMKANLAQEIKDLKGLTTAQLKARYAVVFGEETHANHRAWLIKRIAWRLQALALGELSERARLRAMELANDADLRLNPPKPTFHATGDQEALPPQATLDSRLPQPGAILTRIYKGKELEVTVLASGFAFAGAVYGSLSAVAKAITGSHTNGYLFFRLAKKEDSQ